MLDFNLDLKGIACSKGSACQSGSSEGSHVLSEIQSEDQKKFPSVRFSFSYDKDPTETDPVGALNFDDVSKLFGGEIIYYNKYGSNYSDIILKIKK